MLRLQAADRQEHALWYYHPVNPTAATIHTSICKTLGIGGGNRASKTDTMLAEMVIRATGQIPLALRETYPRSKLNGPIRCRLVCESITTTLYPTILPKLQWWQWNGLPPAAGTKGHYGWVPKICLLQGSWEKSWTDKLRTLRLYYRNPDHPERIEGESLIQFMSYDQHPSDFASGEFSFIGHDEPPTEAIWTENCSRVMSINGTVMLAMTWPDDPSIPVDWIFDQIYEKAQPGSEHDPSIQWVNLSTLENPHLNQDAIAVRAGQMSEVVRQTRIFGQPIRLSNRLHPTFTDVPRPWCLSCRAFAIPDGEGACSQCQGSVVSLCHVQPLEARHDWPCLCALDPHPRKPHMLTWVQVTPNDELEVIDERAVEGGPEEVRDVVAEVEEAYGWRTIRRLIDPNMGRSPSGTNRITTWQDSFAAVGLNCDLADDSIVGLRLMDEYLEPDQQTQEPRWRCDPRCTQTISQYKRWCWEDYRRSLAKGIKQVPQSKHDDFPTLHKYIVNSQPTFRGLKMLAHPWRPWGQSAASSYTGAMARHA